MKNLGIKRYNYPAQFGSNISSLASDLSDMLLSGEYVLTKHVTAFEEAFAQYIGCTHAVGVNSGTDALTMSLLAIGIRPGTEVITQANTFHATVAAICRCGAKPVLVDATEDSFEFNQTELDHRLSDNTAAVIPVHLYGYPTDITRILDKSKIHGFTVIEDAAQAHGARINGSAVGSFGELGCFSFHPSKNLAAAGDAGAITCSNASLAAKLLQLRSLGQAGQNEHVVVGMNSKLDAIQAVVLSYKLALLDKWNSQRRKVAQVYKERLQDLPVSFQEGKNSAESVYHLLQVRVAERDRLLSFLQRHQIDATVRYPVPIHLQPAFAHIGWSQGEYPVAEKLANELLCLPIRPDMDLNEIDQVCEVVRRFYSG